MITLSHIKDDHFISYTCSLLFIIEIFSRIYNGYISDIIHMKVIQNLIFLQNILIIIIWTQIPDSKFFYFISILLVRWSAGMNSVTNGLILYKYYTKEICLMMLKYFSTFYFVGTTIYYTVDKIFKGNDDYNVILYMDLLMVLFSIYLNSHQNYIML